ncbi:hypothetical protein N7501_011829 [Penicillium viridicatum]|nr:hypothetical protein N7501_011829 [Penicillium viridicatum]
MYSNSSYFQPIAPRDFRIVHKPQSSIALLGICLSFPSVRAWLRRLWGSLCDRLAQWRHSLPRIYPGGTSDVEQGLDDHSTELDDLPRAILPAPPEPALLFAEIPPLPPRRVDWAPPVPAAAAAADPPADSVPSPSASPSSSPRRRSTRPRPPPQYYGREGRTP